MVKRRHKPISDSEISTLADQQRPEKVGSKRRLPFCGVPLVLFAISLSTPGAERRVMVFRVMPPAAASRPMVGFLSLVHPA
jgi:hypothetical protein